MQYFVTGTDGNEYGPVDLATLQEWVKDNRVVPTSKVRNASNGMVLQASTMPEVSNLFPPAPVPSMGTVAPMAGYDGRPSYAQPDMTAQMLRNQNSAPWKEFWIIVGLSVLEIVVGAVIGFFSIILGSYVIRRAIAANQNGEEGGILAIVIAVICTIIGVGIRLVFGSLLYRSLS